MSAAPDAQRPMETPSVLVVDDDLDIRETLAEILAEEGYSVATANNGAEALEQLTGSRPALILLDLNMPVMNGLQFLEVQRRNPSIAAIPTVLLTAVDRVKRAEHAATLGPVEAVAKPIKLPELLSLVARFCR